MSLAGQVGFIPQVMDFQSQDPSVQSRQCYVNCERVISVVKSDLKNVIHGTIFYDSTGQTVENTTIVDSCKGSWNRDFAPKLKHSQLEPLFLGVPHLPRSAKVEVQVSVFENSLAPLFHDSSIRTHKYERERENDTPSLTCSVSGLVADEVAIDATAIVSVADNSESHGVGMHAALSHGLSSLESFMKEHGKIGYVISFSHSFSLLFSPFLSHLSLFSFSIPRSRYLSPSLSLSHCCLYI